MTREGLPGWRAFCILAGGILPCGEDCVGDGGGGAGGSGLVDADDGSSGEDGGGEGCDGGVFAGVGGGGAGDGGLLEGVGEEGFAGEADEERVAEGEELGLAAEEREVFVEALAEAVAGVEDDGGGVDASLGGEGEAAGEAVEDVGEEGFWREGGLGGPLVGAAACVHEDDAAAGMGADGGHFGIPVEATDVIQDGCAGGECGAGGGGFVGVDGEDGGGAGAEDAFEDGEEAVLLLGGGDEGGGGVAGMGAGAGAFRTEVEDVCAGIEEVESVGDGGVGVEVEATVGEGVWGDVEDCHDEGAVAEGEGVVGELPGGWWTEGGHGGRPPLHRTFRPGVAGYLRGEERWSFVNSGHGAVLRIRFPIESAKLVAECEANPPKEQTAMAEQPGTSGSKVHALTSLRFFAALWVVLYHSFPWNRTGDNVLSHVLDMGAASVSFFFFLSGYILSYVYLQNRSGVDRRKFYVARLARIYPLFVLTMLSSVPFLLTDRIEKYGMKAAIGKTAVTIVGNLAMLQAWVLNLRGLDIPNWSLAVETVFYAIFPLVGFWFWRRTRGQSIGLGLALWVGSVAVVVGATPHLSRDIVLYNPLFHVPTFLVGIVFARLHLTPSVTEGKRSRDAQFAGLLAALVAGGAAVTVWGHLLPVTVLRDGALVPLYCVLIGILSLGEYWPAKVFQASWLVVLGEASYGLYLIHFPVLQAWEALHLAGKAIYYPLYLGTCIGLSVLSFFYFEAPARRAILKRLHTKPRETLETASAAQ